MSRGYWTPAINYCPIERDWERKYRSKKKIMYYDYFSNFARRNCASFSDAVPVHRVVRAVEFKMATGCKFLSLAASWRKSDEIHWSILSLFQGNMLYLIWVIVEEYLGCQCRWGFGTASQSLVGSFCMKFCLNLARVHTGAQ